MFHKGLWHHGTASPGRGRWEVERGHEYVIFQKKNKLMSIYYSEFSLKACYTLLLSSGSCCRKNQLSNVNVSSGSGEQAPQVWGTIMAGLSVTWLSSLAFCGGMALGDEPRLFFVMWEGNGKLGGGGSFQWCLFISVLCAPGGDTCDFISSPLVWICDLVLPRHVGVWNVTECMEA